MTDKTPTPSVAERLAALATSTADARKAQADATLEPLVALVAQAESLSADQTVAVIKGLLPLIDDGQEKMALTNALLYLPGLAGVLRLALAQAQKIASA